MNKKLLLSVFTLVLALSFSGSVFASNLRTIKLIIDGQVTTTLTAKSTVGEFLQERSIVLHEKDYVSHELDRRLVDGWRIEIKRAFTITITVDGEEKEFVVTPDSRVGNVASDLRDEYGYGFYYNHPPGELVTKNSALYFYSVMLDTVSETQPIPYKTEVVLTEDLLVGQMEIRHAGAPGIKELTYDVSTRFGEEPVFTLSGTVVLLEPVNRVEVFGIRIPEPDEMPEIDINAPKEYLDKLQLDSTAYSLDYNSTRKYPSHPAYGITKSGIYAVPGVVAVDPRVIPLGTILYVDGYGYAVAADTGSAIKGMKIDLFFEDVNDALRYGRKKVNVYIVEYPSYEPEETEAQ